MERKAQQGGARPGAGRKPKYGGKTVVMRVPAERVADVEEFLVGGGAGELLAVKEVLRRWRERIGGGERCRQPRWTHACELLKEIEGVIEGNLKT